MLYYPRTKGDASEVENPRMKRLKRDNPHGPGMYQESHSLTERRNPSFSFTKTPVSNYVDQYSKAKAFVPGVGKYKDLDRCFKALGRPVTAGSSLRRRQ